MGTTTVSARRVAAFRSGDTTYYALFETSSCSNIYPQRHDECCVAFGTSSQVNAWILGAMAAVAMGSLRVRGGRSTPLAYLRAWRKAFARPAVLHDREIVLEPSARLYATIPTDEGTSPLELALASLNHAGYTDAAAALSRREAVPLRLHADAAVLSTIYGETNKGRPIAAWRVIRGGIGALDKCLVIKSKRLPSVPGLPTIYSTGLRWCNEPVMAIRPFSSGDVFDLKGASFVHARLLNEYARAAELANEGSGLAMATHFLEIGLEAFAVPLPVRATFECRLKGLQKSYSGALLDAAGGLGTLDEESGQFTIAAKDVSRASQTFRDKLGDMSNTWTSVRLSEEDARTPEWMWGDNSRDLFVSAH